MGMHNQVHTERLSHIMQYVNSRCTAASPVLDAPTSTARRIRRTPGVGRLPQGSHLRTMGYKGLSVPR